MSDILDFDDPLRRLVNWMVRRGEVGAAAAAADLGLEEPAVKAMLEDLVGRGYVLELARGEETRYRVKLAPQPGHEKRRDLWRLLQDEATGD